MINKAINLKIVCTVALTFMINFYLLGQIVPTIEPTIFNSDILPPSPTAASLGEYGMANASLHTGTAKANIPLFNLESTFISVPISLGYSSNGVKINELDNNVGIDWDLNAGGVISRIVRDEPDEENKFYYPNSTYDNDPDFLNYINEATNNSQIDSEPDLFNFNFMGNSGTFVFDHDQKPYILNAKNTFSIEAYNENGSFTFILTDNNGIKYEFGFGNGYEQTKLDYSGANCSRNFDTPVTTSWYLTSIIHPNGKSITFNYTGHTYRYLVGEKHTQTIYGAVESCHDGQDCPIIPDTECDIWMDVDGVYLESIISDNNNIVEFDYFNASNSKPRRVSTIEKKNSDYYILDKVNLDYTSDSHNERNFLSTVSFVDSQNEQVKNYDLSYYRLDILPPRNSYNQDGWGYFNAADNTTFLPEPQNVQASFNGPFANREVNPNVSHYGMLKQIEYPTGGTEIFSYEGNEYKGTRTVYPTPTNFSKNVYGTPGSDAPNTESFEMEITEYQTLTFGISTSFDEYNESDEPYNYRRYIGVVSITNVDNNNTVYRSENLQRDYNGQEELSLMPGTYKVELLAVHELFKLRIYEFRYYEGTEEEVPANNPTGGNRVDYIEKNDGEKSKYTYFIYSEHDDLDFTSAVEGNLPRYFSYLENKVLCGGSTINCEYMQLSSSSLLNLYNISGLNVQYRYVIQAESESLVNNKQYLNQFDGFTENKFHISKHTPGRIAFGDSFFNSTYSNPNKNSGLLTEQRKFAFDQNGDLNIKVKKINSYKTDDRHSYDIKGLLLREKYNNPIERNFTINCTEENVNSQGTESYLCLASHNHIYYMGLFTTSRCIHPNADNQWVVVSENPCHDRSPGETVTIPSSLDHLDVIEYTNRVRWYYIDNTKIYYYDSDGNELLEETDFYYNNPEHRQINEVVSYSGNMGDVNSKKYFYTGDYQNQQNNEVLYDNHIIKPVKITKIKKDHIKSDKVISYNDYGLTTSIYDAKIVSNTDNHVDYFHPNLEYIPTNIYYGADHEIQVVEKNNGEVKDYFWNSDKTKVKAEFINLNENNIFIEDFEEHGSATTNENESLSGSKYKQSSYSISFNKTTGVDYILSYFTYSDGKWNYNEETYNGNTTIIGSRIDQVMIYPKNAIFKAYTYDNSDNIDAIFSDSGNVQIYFYDDFRRLSRIEDHEGNVLKELEYKYRD